MYRRDDTKPHIMGSKVREYISEARALSEIALHISDTILATRPK